MYSDPPTASYSRYWRGFDLLRTLRRRGEAPEEVLSDMSRKTMSVYLNNTWVHQQGGYWTAKAIAFSEEGNDITLSSCHDSPELAYERLVAGMKELGLVPADWDV
jgi:hypothetical protein